MPEKNTQLIVAEYLPPVAAVTLDQHATRIRKYVQFVDETWDLHIAYALLTGRELLIAKEKAGHGKFLPWLAKHFPDLEERSAQRYMRFLLDLASKSDTVSDLMRQPLEIADGKLEIGVLRKISAEAARVLDGQSMTAYMRETAKCRALIPQSARDNSPKLSAEEKLEAERKQARETLTLFVADARNLIKAHDLHKHWTSADFQFLLDEILPVTALCREMKKARGNNAKTQRRQGAKKKGSK